MKAKLIDAKLNISNEKHTDFTDGARSRAVSAARSKGGMVWKDVEEF